MRISDIWEQLENDPSFSHGLLFRRYSGLVLPDVFIALKSPEKLRCIAASISKSHPVDITSFSNLRDINIEVTSDEKNSDRKILLLKLLNNQHKDIFSVLCEDLISEISTVSSETVLVKDLLDRFEKWKSLFDKASLRGLLPEEQRGLYGELFYLRKFLQNKTDHLNVLNSWVGPEKQIRDFQSGHWSVEVKTTHSNNHQKIHISSERQLDTANLEHLFLFHLSLEVRQEAGETLNSIVDSVNALLAGNTQAQTRFRNKLLEAGYFDQHRHLYDHTGYFIRQEVFYRVEDSFPRIEEQDIPPGVGDLKYSIVVSQCTSFIRDENSVFNSINF